MPYFQSPEHQPPKLADRFLRWYCHPDLIEEIQGDLYEDYIHNIKEIGAQRAKRIFSWHVLLFFRLSNIKKITLNFSTMLWRNHVKVSFRNMWKNKGFTLLNALGLTVGLATAIMILLWINDEVSFDKFHANNDRLYRVMRNLHLDGGKITTTHSIPVPLAAALEEDFPEVAAANVYSWSEPFLVTHEEQSFRRDGRFVAPSFFEHLSFPFLAGNPATALENTNSIVISDRLAKQLFGEDWQRRDDILGQGLTAGFGELDMFTLTGVFADIPANSSLQFDVAIPEYYFRKDNDWMNSWTNNGFRMIMEVKPNTDVAALNKKIKNLIRENAPDEEVDIFLQAYSDRHLYSEFENGVVKGGRITYVRIFSFVAIFILLIACINFINLATARSSKRAKEIGVRKTVGAGHQHLIGQFLSESTLLTAFSMILAVALCLILLPYFNELSDKSIHIDWANPMTYLLIFGLLILVGVLSGGYPAFFLASFPVMQVIKGNKLPRSGFNNVRRSLVVFQFILSNLLIISTITCYRQIQFIKDKNLGYNKENVAHFPVEGELYDKYELFKTQALEHEGILSVSGASQLPVDINWSTGGVEWPGRDPESHIEINVLAANYDVVKTLQMELLDGRVHSREHQLDSANILVNEAAAAIMGMDDPVGKKISMWGADGQIIGMVKDFHFNTMYAPIEPLVIRLDPGMQNTIFVRIAGDQTEAALAHLQSLSEQMNPEYPLNYEFLDEAYANSFRSETILGDLAKYFAVIAIFISCLGLLGLAIFAAEQRKKEVSIRKVLGASVSNLLVLLTKEFMLLVLISFVIAAPIAWYASNAWLSDFTYHTSLGLGIFIFAGVLSLIIAFATVAYEAVRAAVSSPVEALAGD